VDDIASGIFAYLAGVKARREEHERRQREWERRQRLALARAREEREAKRGKFLERLIGISKETNELRLFLARLQEGLPEHPSGELKRLLEWAEARLQRLEGGLEPGDIAAALDAQKLFPKVDPLLPPETEGCRFR